MNWLIDSYKADKFGTGMDKAVNSALSGKPSFELNPYITQRYFKDSVVNPMMRTFNEQIKPQIQEGFANVGAFSSRLGAEISRAGTSLQTDFANQAGQLAMSDRNLSVQLAESAANRRMQGIQYAQALRTQPLQEAGMIGQLLTPQQQQLNARSQAQYQDWMRVQPENSPWLGLGLNYIGQSQQAAYQGKNPIGGAVGGAGAGLGVAATLGGAMAAPGAVGLAALGGPVGLGVGAAVGMLGGFFSS